MGFFESKKRLLVLFCSPNGHGHTRMLLDSFLEGFKGKKEWEIKVIVLYNLHPNPCIACGACAKKEGCKFSDLDGF